jgi:hypothetical protein
MFNQVIKIISSELNKSLLSSDSSLNADSVGFSLLNEAMVSGHSEKIILSMVHFEMEHVLRNQPAHRKSGNNIEVKEPPLFINTYLMVASNYKNYEKQLNVLNYAMEFFQSKPYLDEHNLHIDNILEWPAKLEKLSFEWHNLDFDKLSQIWSLSGIKYIPSFLYKVRMMVVEKTENAAFGPPVVDIRFNSSIQ